MENPVPRDTTCTKYPKGLGLHALSKEISHRTLLHCTQGDKAEVLNQGLCGFTPNQITGINMSKTAIVTIYSHYRSKWAVIVEHKIGMAVMLLDYVEVSDRIDEFNGSSWNESQLYGDRI